MRRFTTVAVAVLAIAGSTAVYAQHRQWFGEHGPHMRLSIEDRSALADAKIAAVHAGLKLNADQEKLWPPIDSAVHELVKVRLDRANARMQDDKQTDGQPKAEDPVARLRERADTMAATAAAMKKIADAADPLYKTLDDGQKRRLAMLTHHHEGRGPDGGRHRWMERGEGGPDGPGFDGHRFGRGPRDGEGGSGRL